jgi:hypothetical protein
MYDIGNLKSFDYIAYRIKRVKKASITAIVTKKKHSIVSLMDS